MSPDFILQLVAEVVVLGAACGTTYAAIRADLARLHEKASHAEKSANDAHRRIDGLMQGRQA